jgi:hypothetical protein
VAGKYQPASGQTSCLDADPGDIVAGTGATEDVRCGAGKYSTHSGVGHDNNTEDAHTSCANCPDGKYQPSAGQTSCIATPPGWYAAHPASDDSNYFADNTVGAISLLPCPAGTWKKVYGLDNTGDATNGYCHKCSAGKYQPASGQTGCFECALGTWQELEGQTSCIDVKKGYEIIDTDGISENNEIGICSAGKYKSVVGHGSCIDCPAGKYSDTDGASECTPCAAGRYETNVGTTECSGACVLGTSTNGLEGQQSVESCRSCETGKYANSEGQGVCEDCEAGKYADHAGLSTCTDCPLGHYESKKGAKTCYSLCAAGKSTEGSTAYSACVDCELGKYASSEGSAECTSCPVGYHQSTKGQSACIACAVGKSTNHTIGLENCIACEPGKVANFVGTPACYEEERDVPDNKDITATISVMAAMAVLVVMLGFTYYHREAIFGVSESDGGDVPSKEMTIANRA